MSRNNSQFRGTLERRLIDLTREYCQLLTDMRKLDLPSSNRLLGAIEGIAWSKIQIITKLFDDLSEYDEIMKCEKEINISNESIDLFKRSNSAKRSAVYFVKQKCDFEKSPADLIQFSNLKIRANK